jgi:hypothetical protein
MSLIENNKTKEMEASTLALICRELMLTPDFVIFGIGSASDVDLAMKEAELLYVLRSLSSEKQDALLDVARAFYTKPPPIPVPPGDMDALIDHDHKKH